MKKPAMDILMCPPVHYSIRYVINPWMKLTRQIDYVKADRQWKALYALLKGLRCRIQLVRPAPGLPDMVFTANAGLPVGKQVFLSRFRHKERAGEEIYFRKWFKRKGFKIVELPEGIFFEGAGDALFVGKTLFTGYRFRSDIAAHIFIAEKLGDEVLSLELTDHKFYHMDTCFAPLSSCSVLYFPSAFDRYGQKVIEKHIPDPVPVPRREALRLVCNAVVIGMDVIIHERCPETGRMLAERGFRVHEIDLSEFIKAGGSAKCLTLQL